ncbi:MAG: hypothetical protein JWL61_819 [Gemmatimonadetes bacterium]|nr:hypothetical protein [Gemmatimonadota bacterium]
MTRLSVAALALLTFCGLAPTVHPAAAQRAPLRGIAFTVDSAYDGEIIGGMLSSLRLKIAFARGRGRIDVLARATRPAVQFKWVTFARTSAVPGDYYLFDSISYVHVRPASRTYTRYSLAAVSHNYQGRRDQWPFFRYDAEKPDTLRGAARPTQGSRSDYTVFWHTELTRDTSCTGMSFGHCLVRELARGRDDVRDAPSNELGIARWFGPTRALAQIAGLDSLVGAPIRVTAIGYWKESDERVLHAASIKFLLGLEKVTIAPARLTLPLGYKAAAAPHSGRIRRINRDGGTDDHGQSIATWIRDLCG